MTNADSAAAGTPARQTHQHEYREFQVCWICGKTEAAVVGCHHCNDDDSVKNGRCWWCLKPVAEPTPPSTGRPLDNGNPYIFCDTVRTGGNVSSGCIRGAGHNGDHVFGQQPYPQSPILLANPAPVSGEGTGTLTRYLSELASGVLRLSDAAVQRLASELLVELRAKDAQLAELSAIKKQAKCLRLEHLIDGDDLAKRSETIHALQTYEAVAALQIENKKLESTLADLRRQGEWQPIASAPKDADKHGLSERIILGFAPDETGYTLPSCEGYWRQRSAIHEAGWVSTLDALVPSVYLKPTQWRPLPDPPAQS